MSLCSVECYLHCRASSRIVTMSVRSGPLSLCIIKMSLSIVDWRSLCFYESKPNNEEQHLTKRDDIFLIHFTLPCVYR
jgi:hypothetical protein